MANGSVKFFNAAKGFGFITPEGGAKDVFVPAASVTASGLPTLKPGQIVSFDTEPDGKGPKAVNLKLVAEAPVAPRPVPKPVPQAVKENSPPPREPEQTRLTLYYDPAQAESQTVLEALRDLGHAPRLVDYVATPPNRDVLKNLSLLLRGGDQSLVKKYDSLFLELRLDDRFISDSEFWAGIVEHPTLINGPVLASAHKARVCRNEAAVRAFLGLEPPEAAKAAAKPKGMPQAIAAVKDPAPPKAEAKMDAAPKPGEQARPKTAAPPKPAAQLKAKPPQKAKAKPAKPPAKSQAKAPAKTKTKAVKAVKVAKPKKAPAKPAKKSKAAKKK